MDVAAEDDPAATVVGAICTLLEGAMALNDEAAWLGAVPATSGSAFRGRRRPGMSVRAYMERSAVRGLQPGVLRGGLHLPGPPPPPAARRGLLHRAPPRPHGRARRRQVPGWKVRTFYTSIKDFCCCCWIDHANAMMRLLLVL